MSGSMGATVTGLARLSGAEAHQSAEPAKAERRRLARRRAEEREYRAACALTFLPFLALALVSRALPRGWRPVPADPTGQRSVFGDARATAALVLPFVFMR